MLAVLVALGAVVLYYLISWLHFRTKYDMHKIPSPPAYPIVGHLFDFLAMPRLNYNSWTLESAKKLGYPKVMKVDNEMLLVRSPSMLWCVARRVWRHDAVHL